ncbi:MAG TPA: sugar ABC transporter permease YjfF [Fimbriimonadaceae bacterium]|nr:sugar ABC transporter permease YjfF [Fimbriimonadaceae bacterium]
MKGLLTKERLPMLATVVVCVLLYVASGMAFPGFFSPRVAVNFLDDNAFLGVIAVGLTFVIITGGIDLSVGSVAGASSILTAVLIHRHGVHPAAAMAAGAGFGLVLGLVHGVLIARFRLTPFLVTLGGLFLARGVALAISRESVQIDDPLVATLASEGIKFAKGVTLTWNGIAFLLFVVLGIVVARQTRFGRTVYAIGGNPTSVGAMGLPVTVTLVKVYACSGLCAGLGGVMFATYTASGNALSGTGLELDAIAAVVIGGTLLTGGYGSVVGTLFGVLTLGIIQTAITFQGTLSSWWSKIVIGALLLMFVLIQKGIERTGRE